MRAGAVLVAVLSISTAATAFAPRKTDMVRVPPVVLDARVPADARERFDELARRGWRASWDRATGVPAWLWGGDHPAPGALGDGAVAERVARDFLAAHAAVLAPGADASEFRTIANQRDGQLRTLALEQTWAGLRVAGGHVAFVFGDGRLIAVRSSARPRVRAHLPAARGLPASHRDRIDAWLEQQTGRAVAVRATGERVVVDREDGTYRVADVLDARALDGPDRWEVLADAGDGTPLRRASRVMFATGTLAYNAGVRHAGGARVDHPASAAAIRVDGSAALTGLDGAFAWPGASPASVEPGLAGPFVQVVDQAGAPASATLTAQPGVTTVWNRADDELADAQLSAFVYASQGKARARGVTPSLAAWLDTPLPVFVNEAGSCNAYSTGTDVHLLRASERCENSGRVADIVVHELGHALHAQALIPGVGAFDPQLSEGLADFFAANHTGDPAVGRGLFRTEQPLRDIDVVGFERVYPDDVDYDPHLSGLIIAGALWDLRKALIAQLGEPAGIARTEQIFTGILQRADSLAATYVAAMIADDDNADLGDGTPNGCALERAFGAHGLVPGFAATTITPPIARGLTLTVPITVPAAAGCPLPAVASVTIAWRTDGGSSGALALVDDGAGRWSGTLPDQPEGTVVSYAVDVAFDDGSRRALPNNEADPRYQLFVGEPVPIWCETFDLDPAWQQTSSTTAEWQWAPAEANPTTDDPDAAYSGTHVLGTAVTGGGAYRPGIVASIATPVIDVTGWQTVRLQYRRWLTVEDATYDVASIVANGAELWRNAQSVAATLDHVDREWRFHDLDLTPHVADGLAQVRWDLATDPTKQLGGWTLDDVCIVGVGRAARCGDGVVDAELGERCDDGNRDDGDGCSATCLDEPEAGGGGCCSGSAGSSSALLALGALLALARPRRRALSA